MVLPFDPTPLVENPRWATPGGFTIRRYNRTVDNNGRTVTTNIDIHAEGVIVPSGNLGMVRTPERESQGNGITIYTKAMINLGNAATNTPADDIIWHGLLWQVTNQDDWSDFSFNVAQAVLAEPGGRNV